MSAKTTSPLGFFGPGLPLRPHPFQAKIRQLIRRRLGIPRMRQHSLPQHPECICRAGNQTSQAGIENVERMEQFLGHVIHNTDSRELGYFNYFGIWAGIVIALPTLHQCPFQDEMAWKYRSR